MRGVPLRIEIGPRDVANKSVVLARRDIPGRDGKSFADWAGLEVKVSEMLVTIQQALFDKALKFREEHTHLPTTYEEFKSAVEDGFAQVWWCGKPECENAIRDETKASNRCIPLDQPGGKGRCIVCGGESTEQAIFARAY